MATAQRSTSVRHKDAPKCLPDTGITPGAGTQRCEKGSGVMASTPHPHPSGATSTTDSGLSAARTPAAASPPAVRRRTRRPAKPAPSRAPHHGTAGPRGWTVIETLHGVPEDISMVLLDGAPRSFSKLARSKLPSSLLRTVVAECLRTGETSIRSTVLEDERVFRLVGMPILGPAGGVFAVVIWSAGIREPMPEIPKVGAVEWTPSGLLTGNPGAEYLLRPPNELPEGRTVPELLASFDTWDNRLEFLEMFNFTDTPADQWTGLATKHYADHTNHQLHIAARAVGTGPQRRVRAVVCDVTALGGHRAPDPSVTALRSVPILPGHALALVDLGSAFVHEWLTNDPLLAGWRHHNPLYDLDGRARVAATCRELAYGKRDHATVEVRVRFSPNDDWIDIQGQWTRLPGDTLPQAMLDITPISPNPPPLISGCDLCYDLAHPQ